MRFFERFMKPTRVAEIRGERDTDVLLALVQNTTRSIRERREAIRRLGEIHADRTGGPIEGLIQASKSPDTSAEAAAALDEIAGAGSFRMLTLFESVRDIETNALARDPLDQMLARMTGHYVTTRYEVIVELYLTALKYPQLNHGANRTLEFVTDALVATGTALHDDTSLISRLCNAIQSDNVYVKTNALIVLRKILSQHVDSFGAKNAREAVEDALNDANPHIRVSAINAFVAMTPPARSRSRLMHLLEEEADVRVRKFVKEAVDAL